MSTPTIDTTPGSPTANSYASVYDADLYFATRLALAPPWPQSTYASVDIGSGDNGVVALIASDAGEAGNGLSVAVVLGVGNSLPLAVTSADGALITVTLGTTSGGIADGAKNTAMLVAAALEALMFEGGLMLSSATASGTGATAVPVTAETDFTGGTLYESVKNPLLIMATRLLDQQFQPGRRLVRPTSGSPYYVIRRQWLGSPASTTQRLAWPRAGLVDRNGNAVPSDSLPEELIEAVCELAGQLLAGDRTLDSDVSVQGLTSLRVGSVSLAFRESMLAQVLPDAVVDLLVPTWFTDETVESAYGAEVTLL